MNRNRTSIVWSLSKEAFQILCKNSNSIAEISRSLGFTTSGFNYSTIYKRIQEDQIDISHIKRGYDANRGRAFPKQKKPLDHYVGNPNASLPTLKKKLLESGLLEYTCSLCGQEPIWNGKPMTLIMDHIDGDNRNNNLNNLRIICRHCDSQLDTYCGRAKKLKSKCIDCNQRNSRKSLRCTKCEVKRKRGKAIHKIDWPDNDILLRMIADSNYSQVGRTLGVSDNAIRKHLKAC